MNMCELVCVWICWIHEVPHTICIEFSRGLLSFGVREHSCRVVRKCDDLQHSRSVRVI